MKKLTALSFLLLCCLCYSHSQTITDLFQPVNNAARKFPAVVSKQQGLQIDKAKLSTLHRNAPAAFDLQLPFEEKQLKIKLKKVKITADNFSVIEASASGRRTVQYNDGIFYQGTIEGEQKSFVTISVFNDQLMGVMADKQSNIVLGSIEENGKAGSEYTMYRDKDLLITNPGKCFTTEEAVKDKIANLPGTTAHPAAKGAAVGEPVDIYFECDYKFYQDKSNSTINVINYVLGFFNNTALIYDNENIKVQVSQILVWTSQDPEAAAGLNTTGTVLSAFASRMLTTNFNGDYAHFLSTRALGGGVAYLLGSNPCNYSKQYKTAVSAISNSYANFPTYSWTINVVTHEMGHNLGSNHTHWCSWPGGPIDGCGPTYSAQYAEGSCAVGPIPTGVGGTIMSYCHLLSTGINLNNGFGPLPGQAIRDFVSSAACFGNCRMTIVVNKQDASCNQNNGSATITATNATGALTYSWSNGQTGATLINAAPGTYHVTVKDAAGCQVMEDFVIGNAGTTLNFSLTPSGNAGFCTGGNILLTATNNGSYTYQWYNGANPINGATTNTYTASTAGTYSVTATSGACSGTQTVTVAQVAAPTAAITAGSATTFCTGGSVVLNGNAGGSYTYQWYNGANLINGAVSATYTATASGSYTVKVSAGSACSVTSTPVVVTVNPSPTATITAGGTTSFCAGGNVVLTSSSATGYSYQWYRNNTIINGAVSSTYTANTSGNYTVKTTVGTCSVTSAATTVTVWPNPVVTVSPVSSVIQKFQTQTLTGNGAPNYNWAAQPFMVSNTSNSVTVKPLTTTAFAIKGRDNNGCESTANATVQVIGCGDVTNIAATPYSPSRVVVKWTNPQDVTADTLQYRKAGETVWQKVFVTGESYEINGLQPGSNYEYNIIPLCSTTNVYIASTTATFATEALNNGLYIRLFPNPASSVSRLEIISADNFIVQLAVYDNAGKLAIPVSSFQSFAAGQAILPIGVDKLSNGIYHLVVTVNGKKQSIKISVMH